MEMEKEDTRPSFAYKSGTDGIIFQGAFAREREPFSLKGYPQFYETLSWN